MAPMTAVLPNPPLRPHAVNGWLSLAARPRPQPRSLEATPGLPARRPVTDFELGQPGPRHRPVRLLLRSAAFVVTAALAAQIPCRGTCHGAALVVAAGQFLLVVLLEIVAINVIVLTLAMHHLDAYQMPAIALVVGLHFFPLARVFAMPHYVLTGAVMTAASIGGIALLVIGSDARLCNTGVDFACAAILWTTAGLTLRLWRQRSDGRPSRR
ncbi:MAG: hypothetical protein WDW38_006460 [Sanguina aurantia]